MFRASYLTVGDPGRKKKNQVFGVFLEALFKGVFVCAAGDVLQVLCK